MRTLRVLARDVCPAAAAILVACSGPVPPRAPQPAEADASAVAPEPSPLASVDAWFVGESGRSPLSAAGVTEVAPAARFEIDLPRAETARVRLFDSAGRMVESRDRRESGSRTRYRLDPAAPLEPGTRYDLVVDAPGSASRMPDPAEVRFQLRTAGEKCPAPVPLSAKKSKRRPR